MTFTLENNQLCKDGTPFQILSGGMHYFRVPRSLWRDRLLKLKECGLNTVETYVAWNAHEPLEGQFDFSGILDLGAFLDLAAELGLYCIVRPGPFICAEWDGGGLPAWLLNVPGLRIRCDNAPYLEKVRAYFTKLFSILVPRLCTHGGNILMLQVENEYGSYGNDKQYLRKLEALYRELGADCLLYRSDGDAPFMMHGAETGIYVADNFGSDPLGHKAQMEKLGYHTPFFCGEYWCGWFDHWYENHHRRAASDIANELRLFMETGSHVNFYMFHGGTNFGFWNGANDLPGTYLPTTTSYDYDALLNEAGDRTEKYYAVRDVLKAYVPVPELTATDSKKTAYGTVPCTESAPLFTHLSEVARGTFTDANPLTMEEAASYFGYMLYETELEAPHGEKLIPDRVADRLTVYLDGKRHAIMERGREIVNPVLPDRALSLAILCENTGRVNYGPCTLDRKGLSSVRVDLNYQHGWKTTALPMDNLSRLTFEPFALSEQPCFHRATFRIDGQPCDTFLSMRGWHKGFAVLNGNPLGRYYTDAGPQYTLYVPAGFLRKGENQLILFESDQTEQNTVTFIDHPDFGD